MLHRRERNREVLNRESGRVEGGDVVVCLPSRRATREDVAELRHDFARDAARLDGVGEIAVVRCLLKVMNK